MQGFYFKERSGFRAWCLLDLHGMRSAGILWVVPWVARRMMLQLCGCYFRMINGAGYLHEGQV